ncbi:MbtH family protein [Streptomyces fradiae]|uniref:MbtH family protein n=1 Tax=Streptomyces fradiae TaxID=1906 RepID=UPI00367DD682
MLNPFDDPDGTFVVLRNEENQHSLWPARMNVPDGWSVAFGEHGRGECLAYVEENWPDIRPAGAGRGPSR